MQLPESFLLDGWRYWTETRKCGKTACRRCMSGGRHAGYWHRRNLITGERQYIGRHLDNEIIQRAEQLAVLRSTIQNHLDNLHSDTDLLERLLRGGIFTASEKRQLEKLGYGSLL